MKRANAAARAHQPAPSALSWIFGTSPWLLASLVAVCAACAIDLLVIRPPARSNAIALLTGLAVFFGLLHGAAWSLLWVLVGKLPGKLRAAFWPLVGLAAGLWLAYALGAFSRLQGRYWQLAVGVLAACSLGGIAFGFVCAAFQPRPDRPPWLLARATKWRLGTAFLLTLAAAGLYFADRRFYPGQYSYAHIGLRLGYVWLFMMALVAAARVVPLPPTRLWGWLVAIGFFVACLFVPSSRRLLPALAARPWPALILQVSQRLSDVDGDGYSAFLGGGDCAAWNPRVNPGAREIPDNGIDDNCLLGDATRKIDRIDELPVPKEPSPRDVVLITVDSLRPAHLGFYNEDYGSKGRATSPNLDRFASNATVFERAYTSGAWTSVAIPSLLRGVYARRLRWTKWFETTMYAVIKKPFQPKLRPGEQIMRMFPLAFDDRHPPIASILRRRGMHTAAVTDDGHSEMLQVGTGLEEGFVSFREVDTLAPRLNNDEGTTDMAISTLRRLPDGQRFFLWVHYFGVHWPDDEHPGTKVYGTETVDKYDHEIAFFDTHVGRLLEHLAARKEPPAVIIAADHSEGLAGGVRQHGLTLDEEVIRIPLVVKVPGWPVARVRQPVSSIDLVPTILGLTGSPAPRYLDGIDLGEVVSGQRKGPRVLFSDTWRYDSFERLELNFSAAFDGVHKVVLDRMTGAVYEFEQRREGRTPGASSRPALSNLTRALFGYLEETGGALDLSE